VRGPFIKSQVGEGWRLIKTAYDDGGPFRRYDAASSPSAPVGRYQTQTGRRGVVVYKVDRPDPAPLADFAQDGRTVRCERRLLRSCHSAVSTPTTSMGRLTLNVLLSFAQFEREGKRASGIRDKIAASKRKGMWMGGVPPLGYDVP